MTGQWRLRDVYILPSIADKGAQSIHATVRPVARGSIINARDL